MFEDYARAAFHFVQGRELWFEGGIVLIVAAAIGYELLRKRGVNRG